MFHEKDGKVYAKNCPINQVNFAINTHNIHHSAVGKLNNLKLSLRRMNLNEVI